MRGRDALFLGVGLLAGMVIARSLGVWKDRDVQRFQLVNAEYKQVTFGDDVLTSLEKQKKSLFLFDTKTGDMFEVFWAANDWAGFGFRSNKVTFPVPRAE